MEQFPISTKAEQNEPSDKEMLGRQFKAILKEKAEEYDTQIAPSMKVAMGEDFVTANRSMFILKGALGEFIKIDGFPAEDKQEIFYYLSQINWNDPVVERSLYHNTEDIGEKNTHAIEHNAKIEQYKSFIKGLLEQLEHVLPEDMYQELLFRNDMFANVLSWVDREYSKKD